MEHDELECCTSPEEHGPICEDCTQDWGYTPVAGADDARALLAQRCRDAGWKQAKIDRYLNRVLPMSPWSTPVSG